jgi:carbon-monoxide dehydrogenase small subunit
MINQAAAASKACGPEQAGLRQVRFILNGSEAVFFGRSDARLLDALRDVFSLTSVKCGCREGECGACSVIMDGRLVNSCLVAMGRVEGSGLLTLEGFRETERFGVLEKAYAKVSAVQCGFCIPGMVLASETVLSKNPRPSESDIRTGLSGNLCRCTGYNAIVEAITIASEMGEGLW